MAVGAPRRTLLATVVLALALVAGSAAYVVHTQAQARGVLRGQLGQRAALCAHLVGGALMSNISGQQFAAAFGVPLPSLPASVRRYMRGSDLSRLVVLDGEGRVLAASSGAGLRRGSTGLARRSDVRVALRGRPAISNEFAWRSQPTFEVAVPLGPAGRGRVLALAAPVEVVRAFADGLLAGASAVRGGRVYLVDGRGQLLASEVGARPGWAPADRPLAQAALHASGGTHGDRTFAAAGVPRAQWRVLFSVPTAGLYASVDGAPRRAAWALFGAFAAAIVALLALAVAALRGARRMAILREREQAARELAHERLHDALTGLPNRALVQDRIEHAIASLPRQGGRLAVLFVDVDRFKRVNDSLGHDRGDALLREVAQRLQRAMRPGDTVGRFGGDEFVVLCVDLRQEETALRIARRVQQLLEPPVRLGDREITIGASIGLAVLGAPDRPVRADDLIRDADVAMYRAKQQGGGRIEVFDARLHREAIERLDSEAGLRQAVARDELVLHYQPIVRLPDRSVRGVEALVRWQRDPDQPPIPAGAFIPLAEESGAIGAIGEWVLRQAVDHVGAWAEQGALPRDFTLFVNVSAHQLADPELPASVRDALAGWSLPPDCLCLELTESAVASDPAAAERMLGRLHELGVRLAIDDFGVGHSSLGQLSRVLPISVLKLDRSFVANMRTDRDRGILLAAASLARALEVASVAEGVESGDQADELAKMGFTLAQGYHFGRPVEPDQLLAALSASTAS